MHKLMLKKLSENLGAKFPTITCGYFMVKIAHLNGAFLEVSTSKPIRKAITVAKRKGEKGMAKKNLKIEKPKDVGHFAKAKML